MVRLFVFVEGKTELTFADTVLKPHLAVLDVYLERSIEIAHARKKRVVHRGGGRNYLPMKNDIVRTMNDHRGPDLCFTTMIDLYAIQADFPGLDAAEKLRHLPYQRVASIETAFANDIGDNRFIPYIQLHEFEACLFSDPDHFRTLYEKKDAAIKRLSEIATSRDSPELIDDGQHTAPSKRILKHLPDFSKTADGPRIAQSIGLKTIREKCPHFDAWLSRLESLEVERERNRV